MFVASHTPRRRAARLVAVAWLFLALSAASMRDRIGQLRRQRGALGLEWAWIAAGVCALVFIVYVAVKASTNSGTGKLNKNLP